MSDAIFAPGLLDGRAALVTGGGSGIGYGIAGCLLEAGARVCIASRDLEKLEAAAADLEGEHGGEVLPLATNVREPERVRDTVDRAADELGSLDVLVNNAAGNFYCPTEELTPGGWKAVVETDLYGSFYCARAAFPHMRDAGWGRIVSISMTLHYRGWPMMAHASAAKAGIDGLTRTLALEWAEHGINVNAVAPGPIPTEGVLKAFEASGGGAGDAGGSGPDGDAGHGGGGGVDGEGGPDGEGDAAGAADAADAAGAADAEAAGASPGPRATQLFAEKGIPVGRLGRPEDIGRMVTYLVSPAGDWITGAIFVVDGGEWLQKVGMTPPGG